VGGAPEGQPLPHKETPSGRGPSRGAPPKGPFRGAGGCEGGAVAAFPQALPSDTPVGAQNDFFQEVGGVETADVDSQTADTVGI